MPVPANVASGFPRLAIRTARPSDVPDHHQPDHLVVNETFTPVLEVHRDPVADNRLNLPDSPVRALGMPDECARNKTEHHGLSRNCYATVNLHETAEAYIPFP